MRTVEEVIADHDPLTMDSLIPVLQDVQTENGFLSTQSMEEISLRVGVPISRVYGVATFYKQFRFAPLGEHVIEVCRGTACHVKGSLSIADHLKRRLKLKSDGNSADGKFSLVTVACLGACSIAPVIKMDGEFHGHLDLKKLDGLIDQISEAREDGGDA
jgi:NADH-quinone oxidoreductase subunit E